MTLPLQPSESHTVDTQSLNFADVISFVTIPRGFARLPIVKKTIWRAVIEVGFIIFLFYSNLLMSEFARTGKGREMGLAWAVADIFTVANFGIAVVAALIGYVAFEFLRSKS